MILIHKELVTAGLTHDFWSEIHFQVKSGAYLGETVNPGLQHLYSICFLFFMGVIQELVTMTK